MSRQEQTDTVIKVLSATYPDAHCELDFTNPLELVVATVLSAQCTDKRVNLTTPTLFERCRTAQDYAGLDPEQLEEIIRPTGFYRAKARNLRGLGAELVAKYRGDVPADMEALRALPGVGRKTANVVLGNAFGKNEGIAVDTHVGRVSLRLGLTKQTDPLKTEADLMKLVPREDWTMFSHWLIFHGRRRCFARSPDCPGCELRAICPTGKKLLKKAPPSKAPRKAKAHKGIALL